MFRLSICVFWFHCCMHMFQGCPWLYCVVVKKMITIFPFDDKVLADLVVLEPVWKMDLTYAPSTYNITMSISLYFSALQ